MRPDFTNPYEAARVSRFMGADSHGRWSIEPFTVTEEMAVGSHIMARLKGGERGEMAAERTVPPDDYVCLRRKVAPGEADDHVESVPIMSDTPAEISEHSWIIDNAHGRVLITGLGLGCVVSALLAKSEVEHITVVEVDRDVIALTGPYYATEPRVTIISADALRYAAIKADAQRKLGRKRPCFDFAWHDIWSSIADRNLNEATAEHGIAYQTLFDAYAPFCKEQGAWAYEQALKVREVTQREEDRLAIWIGMVINSTPEQRIPLIENWIIRQQVIGLPEDADIPDGLLEFYREHGQTLQRASELAIDDGWVAKLEVARDRIYTPDPMPRPNEVEEANVAR